MLLPYNPVKCVYLHHHVLTRQYKCSLRDLIHKVEDLVIILSFPNLVSIIVTNHITNAYKNIEATIDILLLLLLLLFIVVVIVLLLFIVVVIVLLLFIFSYFRLLVKSSIIFFFSNWKESPRHDSGYSYSNG